MSITKTFRRNVIGMAWLILVSGSIVWVADAAQADEAIPHKLVRFKDVNLSNTDGPAVLYERIKSAANEVCGKKNWFGLSQVHKIKLCINEAVSRAVAEINSPLLTSIYQAKTGKSDTQTATLAQAR